MDVRSNPPARVARLAGEFLIIVVGVLVALSADTWIQSQQERQSEGAYLQALREDLVETRLSLQESNAERDRIFNALTQLANSDLGVEPPDSVAEWVYTGLFLIGSFRPQLAALSDIQTADQVRLLTPEVRREIAELDRALVELAGVEDDFTRSQQSLLDPYLVARTPLVSILAAADSLPLPSRSLSEADWRALPREELLNAIAFKMSLGKVAAGFRTALGQQLERLGYAVDARLEELGVVESTGG